MTSYKTVERIHRDVNASVTYRTDLQQYGVPDFWQKAGKYGDCEDYALLKRAKLLEAGCPPDRVNLVTCLVGGTPVIWGTIKFDSEPMTAFIESLDAGNEYAAFDDGSGGTQENEGILLALLSLV